jgi:hypothetical protein
VWLCIWHNMHQGLSASCVNSVDRVHREHDTFKGAGKDSGKKHTDRGTHRETDSIPSSGIFRVSIANWLRACVSLRKTRNIKRRERPVARRSASNPCAGNALLHSFRRPVLDCRTRRDTNARSLVALGLGERQSPSASAGKLTGRNISVRFRSF